MQLGKFEVLDQLVEEGNGYLLTAVVLDHGVSKKILANYVEIRGLERIAHGVYMAEDAWKDDYYLLSARNSKVVFSHESALYLYTLMDREPSVTTVTVPKNYNSTHIAKQGVRVIHTKPEWYGMGVIHVKTSFGNEVPVYDRERTMCDIIRAKKDLEIQTFQTAVREYMSSSGKNLGNLMQYAKALGVEDEVRTYTEVMLWNRMYQQKTGFYQVCSGKLAEVTLKE